MRKQTELRPYQDRIATHLYEHDAALCVVRPGGGKTISALTAIGELQRDKVIRHALVIAPKRVAENVWPDELDGWEHTEMMQYVMITGNAPQREMVLRGVRGLSPNISILGLDNVKWLLEQIEGWPDDHPIFDLLVIDEISKLRAPTGVRAKLLGKHAKRFRMIWGLSGTLRPNSAEDLFMPARIVSKGALWGRSFYQWRQQYFRPIDFMGYQWAALPGSEDKLNADLAPLVATLQEDEYPQLPQLSVQFDYVTLPPAARVIYKHMHTKLVAKMEKGDVVAVNAAVATGKLAQIANGFIYPHDHSPCPAEIIHDEKREWLADVIEQATGPTLLIYEYQQDLQMICELLPQVPIIGGNNGVPDRTVIDAWNAGKLPFVALHPAAGGHGLNLQHGGSDIAWISPTWSPELWEQTIARLHRPGQTKPVIVRVCVARDTVDQMKLDRVQGKMSAQAAFENYLRRSAVT